MAAVNLTGKDEVRKKIHKQNLYISWGTSTWSSTAAFCSNSIIAWKYAACLYTLLDSNIRVKKYSYIIVDIWRKFRDQHILQSASIDKKHTGNYEVHEICCKELYRVDYSK